MKRSTSPVNGKGTAVDGLSITSHTIGVDLCLPEAEQLGGRLDPEQPDQEPDTHYADLERLLGIKDGRIELVSSLKTVFICH
jgi:hypothetical protein